MTDIVYECWVQRTGSFNSDPPTETRIDDHRFTRCKTQLEVSHWLVKVMSDGMNTHDHIHIVKHSADEYHA